MDTERIVKALWRADQQFVDFATGTLGAATPEQAWRLLYGAGEISKMSPDPSSVSVPGQRPPRQKASLKPTGMKLPPPPKPPSAPAPSKPLATGKPAPAPKKIAPPSIGKSASFDVGRIDEDKREVFGWASIVEENGEPVVDGQGDIISPDEMEKSAYQFVLESRKGGRQHRRTEDDEPLHVSDMIESMAFTPEKKEKLGLPDGFPTGWWVGFKVRDDDTWRDVKSGAITSFSIHGRGKRVPVE